MARGWLVSLGEAIAYACVALFGLAVPWLLLRATRPSSPAPSLPPLPALPPPTWRDGVYGSAYRFARRVGLDEHRAVLVGLHAASVAEDLADAPRCVEAWALVVARTYCGDRGWLATSKPAGLWPDPRP